MSRKVISHLYSPSSVVRIGSIVSLASCATENRRIYDIFDIYLCVQGKKDIYDIFDIYLRVQGKTAPLQELPLGLAEVDNRAVDEDSAVLFVPLDRVEVPATGSKITIVSCDHDSKLRSRWYSKLRSRQA